MLSCVFIASELQYKGFVRFGQEWHRRVKNLGIGIRDPEKIPFPSQLWNQAPQSLDFRNLLLDNRRF